MKQKTLSSDNSLPDYRPDKYRWVMLALLWLLYVSFGAIIRTLSPLVTPILADLDMSYSQMGLVMGSWQLTYIGAAFAAGFLIDKWGPNTWAPREAFSSAYLKSEGLWPRW